MDHPSSGLAHQISTSGPQINTTIDERDRLNPFRFPNIGVEKFLELNSEQNHDDYCLAYVFTDRDFDDGVLGLAWVGAPAGTERSGETRQRLRAGIRTQMVAHAACSAMPLTDFRRIASFVRPSTKFALRNASNEYQSSGIGWAGN